MRALVLMLLIGWAATAARAEDPNSARVWEAHTAIARIKTTGIDANGRQKDLKEGIGFLVEKEGQVVIVTAAHVVGHDADWQPVPDGTRVERHTKVVILNGNDRPLPDLEADVSVDPTEDLAVLYIVGERLPTLRFTSTHGQRDAIWAMVWEQGEARPRLINVNLALPAPAPWYKDNMPVETQQLLQAGYSGSPVLNATGEVVGMLTNLVDTNRGIAIPSQKIMRHLGFSVQSLPTTPSASSTPVPPTSPSKSAAPTPPADPITRNCTILAAESGFYDPAAADYDAAVDAYGEAKHRQGVAIAARYPGTDASWNIGMFQAKERARQLVDAQTSSEMARLRQLGETIRQPLVKIRAICAAVAEGAVASQAVSAPGCASSAQIAEARAANLSRTARKTVVSAAVRTAAAESAMKRPPGFDASENISQWGRNVSEFDSEFSSLDGDVVELGQAAQVYANSVHELADLCLGNREAAQ